MAIPKCNALQANEKNEDANSTTYTYSLVLLEYYFTCNSAQQEDES